MSTDAAASSPLPDDFAALRALLLAERAAAQRQREVHERTVAELSETIETQQRTIAQQEHRLALLLRTRFGPRRERIDLDQLLLFDVAEIEALAREMRENPLDESPESSAPADEPSPKKERRGHGRRPLPPDLPRERRRHELPDAERRCPRCGELRAEIGDEISEQLEYVPASYKVIEHVRVKYACRSCAEHVAIADKPPQPIDKGLPGPGLIAHTVLAKYGDHRVQGQAVSKMRGGLSRSGDRIWSQTSPNCVGQEPAWEASGAKGAARPRQVRFAKSNASEPLMKCRNRTDDVKTGDGDSSGISMGGACLPAHVASGIKVARARIRLGNGTLEPVVSMPRETLKRNPRESQSTNARHRGGTTRSSVDGREIRSERRGRVIQPFGNRSTAPAGGTHA